VCGSSEMVLPSSIVNLEKGERYVLLSYLSDTIINYIIDSLIWTGCLLVGSRFFAT